MVSDTNGSGLNDPGDIIIYTIEVENTGNVTLTSISLDDTITDHNGNALSLVEDLRLYHHPTVHLRVL